MPSWNLHCAHAQYVLDNYDYRQLGILNPNCFVFGNYVPDIYVGYMVSPVSKIIPYTITHFAQSDAIPIPSADQFWDLAILPHIEKGERVDDLVLGTWAHLVADNIYNTYTRKFLEEHHIKKGEKARIMKQGDFEKYGRTLSLNCYCEATPSLLSQCKKFCMYSIEKEDVIASIEVANSIVDKTKTNHIDQVLDYELFSTRWFDEVGSKVNNTIIDGLIKYASSVERNNI